jgi:hypothetical protein
VGGSGFELATSTARSLADHSDDIVIFDGARHRGLFAIRGASVRPS